MKTLSGALLLACACSPTLREPPVVALSVASSSVVAQNAATGGQTDAAFRVKEQTFRLSERPLPQASSRVDVRRVLEHGRQLFVETGEPGVAPPRLPPISRLQVDDASFGYLVQHGPPTDAAWVTLAGPGQDFCVGKLGATWALGLEHAVDPATGEKGPTTWRELRAVEGCSPPKNPWFASDDPHVSLELLAVRGEHRGAAYQFAGLELALSLRRETSLYYAWLDETDEPLALFDRGRDRDERRWTFVAPFRVTTGTLGFELATFDVYRVVPDPKFFDGMHSLSRVFVGETHLRAFRDAQVVGALTVPAVPGVMLVQQRAPAESPPTIHLIQVRAEGSEVVVEDAGTIPSVTPQSPSSTRTHRVTNPIRTP